MTNHTISPARRLAAAAIALVLVVVIGVIALQASLTASGPRTASPLGTRDHAVSAGHSEVAFGAEDGVIPDGAELSVFDNNAPALKRLDPALLAAVRAAATDAAADDITFVVNAGWRSRALQEKLLSDATQKYGSVEEARRWVASPDTSAHVTGEAIDLGPWNSLDWLSQHGSRYGLCQIFANETWHYELRPEAMRDGCPAMYADSAEKDNG